LETFAKRYLILAALFLAGCASQALKDCDKPYAHTLPHCDVPNTRPPRSVAECKQVDGVVITENGRYMGCARRDELWNIIRNR
jgi:hypothetical protein